MATLISHINKHYETPKKERKRKIDQIKHELSPSYKKEKEIRKVKKVLTNQELSTFKDKIFPILIEFNVPKKTLNNLFACRNLIKLKRLITSNVSNEVKNALKKIGIDYHAEQKIKKENITKGKDYYDETKSSIIPIYTPMGNKR